MKRVLVIGSSGAGKSTFARRLGAATNIAVVHLDRLYWKPNWVEPDKDEWRQTVETALQRDRWIMDGNYSGTLETRLEQCDTVIFLDFPRHVCVWRVLKRALIYRNRTRQDMAADCAEKLDLAFLKWTWNYPARSKPKVENLLRRCENSKTIVRLRSNREVERFLQTQ